MSDNSHIEWTDTTWFDTTFQPEQIDLPRRWKHPQRVFVNADLFHQDVPEDIVAQVWTVMAATPQHTYLILTKRHARMRSIVRRIAWRTPTTEERRAGVRGSVAYVQRDESLNDHLGAPRVLPNVWLGVSVEDQRWADIRIPALLETPAAVRWISAEPLLGPVDLGWGDPHAGHESDDVNGHPHPRICLDCSDLDAGVEIEWWRRDPGGPRLDWVVVGGESGPGARPMAEEWAAAIAAQCEHAGVPLFFKQAGRLLAKTWGCADPKGGNPDEWPRPWPREFPRTAAEVSV